MEKAMNCMAEALRVTRESEQKFYQNVSHDLRTPLMSIGGYAQGIETGVMKDPVQ
ncbi:MAG TPA: sensor histidine kinase, partial [Oribacterium sp.]|nr:sensor histidine kinase [Oribacterium sp.]